jgi:hypothetical protein
VNGYKTCFFRSASQITLIDLPDLIEPTEGMKRLIELVVVLLVMLLLACVVHGNQSSTGRQQTTPNPMNDIRDGRCESLFLIYCPLFHVQKPSDGINVGSMDAESAMTHQHISAIRSLIHGWIGQVND